MRLPKLRLSPRLAWSVLGYTLLVVLWGAFVRATGSGAGCGEHWPLCNGEVLPRSPGLETMIEFAHRLTSGANLLLVLALVAGAFSSFPKGHRVRRGAVASLIFILSEAAVGAGLVLFGWVAKDQSSSRALVLSIHLINTLLLIAGLAVTAYWTSRPEKARSGFKPNTTGWAALAACLFVGISGAIAALGDTLFPAESLAHGLSQDASPLSHFLIRLRIVHPVLAVAVGAWMIIFAQTLKAKSRDSARFASLLSGLVFFQLALGVLNVGLLAPVWLQLAHLLGADSLWIALVLLVASEGEGELRA